MEPTPVDLVNLREQLTVLMENGVASIPDSRMDAIGMRLDALLIGLEPVEVMGFFAGMLLRVLPEVPQDD